jgi:hypothetical protein
VFQLGFTLVSRSLALISRSLALVSPSLALDSPSLALISPSLAWLVFSVVSVLVVCYIQKELLDKEDKA